MTDTPYFKSKIFKIEKPPPSRSIFFFGSAEGEMGEALR
jgi:hypothetical protein